MRRKKQGRPRTKRGRPKGSKNKPKDSVGVLPSFVPAGVASNRPAIIDKTIIVAFTEDDTFYEAWEAFGRRRRVLLSDMLTWMKRKYGGLR